MNDELRDGYAFDYSKAKPNRFAVLQRQHMTSLADQLPPDIASQIHPDWRKNEAAYAGERDRLLAEYQGKWIAFAEGAVIASATTPLEVFIAIQNSQQHPYVIRVGHEDEPWYRIRVDQELSARNC